MQTKYAISFSRVLTMIVSCGVLAVAVSLSSVAGAEEAATSSASDHELAKHRTMIQRYCITCHNERRNTANVNLEVLNFDDITKHADIWEKMVHKVCTGDMPLPGKRQPSRRARTTLLD